MGLSAAQIGELVREVAPLVEGRLVADVAAHPPRDVVLVLGEPVDHAEPDARVRRLRVSADPEAARLHLVVGPTRTHGGPEGPFFRALAAVAVGRTLARVEQLAGDRLVRVELAGPDDRVALIAELTGRHANLVLVDADGVVTELLVPAKPRAGDSPRIAVGRPWQPPPGHGAAGGDAPLADALPDPPARGGLAEVAPLSWRVEASLGVEAAGRLADEARRDVRQRLARRRKAAERALAGLAKRRAAADDAERIRRDGELVKAVVGTLARGAREAVVQDWFEDGAPERRVALDPKLGPVANVERLFARAKKLERAAARLPEEEERARSELALLDELGERLADPDVDPEELAAEAEARGLLRPRQSKAPPARRKAPPPRLPYRAYRASTGAEVLVGRGAKDNDRLTFGVARGNDLWLHTSDAPGSHVVLRLAKGAEPDPEALLDAAHLAVHHSPLAGARAAAVHVARVKEVRKPRGAKPGLVTLAGGRTIDVRMEPQRLERLLDARS